MVHERVNTQKRQDYQKDVGVCIAPPYHEPLCLFFKFSFYCQQSNANNFSPVFDNVFLENHRQQSAAILGFLLSNENSKFEFDLIFKYWLIIITRHSSRSPINSMRLSRNSRKRNSDLRHSSIDGGWLCVSASKAASRCSWVESWSRWSRATNCSTNPILHKVSSKQVLVRVQMEKLMNVNKTFEGWILIA